MEIPDEVTMDIIAKEVADEKQDWDGECNSGDGAVRLGRRARACRGEDDGQNRLFDLP